MATTPIDVWWSILSWFSNFVTRLVLRILASGPVPQHIGFVMDGNRRYARSHSKRVQEGHNEGFHALHRILDVCLRLNIRCVSVYAFSIENFKRPSEEVEALMSLAKEKLIEMSEKGEILDRHGVRLNIIGRRELLPRDVQKVAAKVESMTQHNTNAILNICMPYTSRDEMTTAVQATVKDCRDDFVGVEDITEHSIDKRLQITARGSPPLDILVRTSGTYRLSDFLLWQASEDCQIHFSKAYWPDYGLWDFIPVLLAYQKRVWTRTR